MPDKFEVSRFLRKVSRFSFKVSRLSAEVSRSVSAGTCPVAKTVSLCYLSNKVDTFLIAFLKCLDSREKCLDSRSKCLDFSKKCLDYRQKCLD